MRRFLSAVLLSALLLTLHGSLLKNSETKAAVHPTAGQRQNATLTAKPKEPVAQVPAVAPVMQETPASQPTQVTGCESYKSLIDQYQWDTRIAMAVMRAESGCNPSGPPSPTCDRGLMQINCIHADMVNGDLESLYNPAINMQVAYRVYLSQGWNGWSTFNSGAYLRYL